MKRTRTGPFAVPSYIQRQFNHNAKYLKFDRFSARTKKKDERHGQFEVFGRILTTKPFGKRFTELWNNSILAGE